MFNNEFYSFDGCYSKPATGTNENFDKNLIDNFYKTNETSVKDCETLALRNNSEFFLVNDLSTNSIGNQFLNCYVPKIENSSKSLIGNSSIIEKALQFFESLFTENSGAFKYMETIDTCDNLLYNSSKSNNDAKCFKYSLDEKVYAPKKYYAYYKKPSLDINNLNLMKNLNPISFYNNSSKLSELKNYEDLIAIDSNNFVNNGPLVNSFKDFICGPTNNNERILDEQIIKLKDSYNNLFNSLDTISADLSNISYLNSFDNDTIKALNNEINTKTNELNSLLGFGGANNGRLGDTTFLTQFKIVENSILLIIIISAIFIYNKSNKTTSVQLNK